MSDHRADRTAGSVRWSRGHGDWDETHELEDLAHIIAVLDPERHPVAGERCERV